MTLFDESLVESTVDEATAVRHESVSTKRDLVVIC